MQCQCIEIVSAFSRIIHTSLSQHVNSAITAVTKYLFGRLKSFLLKEPDTGSLCTVNRLLGIVLIEPGCYWQHYTDNTVLLQYWLVLKRKIDD